MLNDSSPPRVLFRPLDAFQNAKDKPNPEARCTGAKRRLECSGDVDESCRFPFTKFLSSGDILSTVPIHKPIELMPSVHPSNHNDWCHFCYTKVTALEWHWLRPNYSKLPISRRRRHQFALLYRSAVLEVGVLAGENLCVDRIFKQITSPSRWSYTLNCDYCFHSTFL
jgi:hypothetical protein